MNVAEAIKALKKLPDKQLALMLDCPNCGHAQELATIIEMVVLGAAPESGSREEPPNSS